MSFLLWNLKNSTNVTSTILISLIENSETKSILWTPMFISPDQCYVGYMGKETHTATLF